MNVFLLGMTNQIILDVVLSDHTPLVLVTLKALPWLENLLEPRILL